MECFPPPPAVPYDSSREMYPSSNLYAIWLSCVLVTNSLASTAGSGSDLSKLPGVGFDLTSDYGTSAVYFPNGTVTAVAKVEGSQGYKRFMRMEDGWTQTKPDLDPPVHPAQTDWFSRASQAFRRRTQSILSQYTSKSADAASIEGMLLALKVPTEVYLATALDTVDVAIPYPLSRYRCGVIDSSLAAVRLRHALPTQVLAGEMASRANGIGDCGKEPCDRYGGEPQFVLTVGYSRAALTITLYMEDRGVFELLHIQHDPDLGADVLSRSPDSDGGDEMYWKRVGEVFKEMVNMGLAGVDRVVPIGQLVLLGDHATDPRLLGIFKDVVGKDVALEAVAQSRLAEGDPGRFDPEYAAAIGVGRASWNAREGLEPGCKL